MHVRPLRADDVPQVAALWNEAAQAEGHTGQLLSEAELEALTEDENFLPSGAVVAEEDGRLLGFGMGYVQRTDARREGGVALMPGRLAGIAVRPERWREGIGRRLLIAVEDALRSEGKSEAGLEVFRQPLLLARRLYLDSGPYRFFLACGYQPVGHELVVRNDLHSFELRNEIKRRRERLEAEGVQFRFSQASERADLLDFMARHFPGGWHASIERATASDPPARVMIATLHGQILGFMGPFSPPRDDGRASFGSPGVAAEFRGRGIGKVLINLGLDELKRAGGSYAEYSTGVTNTARFIYFDSGAQLRGVCCCHLRKRLRP
jgi:ribosomal protein S18 acetylase RimI-like enzyme